MLALLAEAAATAHDHVRSHDDDREPPQPPE